MAIATTLRAGLITGTTNDAIAASYEACNRHPQPE
jgi:hypothetical protein